MNLQKIIAWMWDAEKFRNESMPLEPVSENNPLPLLMKANSIEELQKTADKFNKDFNHDPKESLILEVTQEKDGEYSVFVVLPYGTCGRLSSLTHYRGVK